MLFPDKDVLSLLPYLPIITIFKNHTLRMIILLNPFLLRPIHLAVIWYLCLLVQQLELLLFICKMFSY